MILSTRTSLNFVTASSTQAWLAVLEMTRCTSSGLIESSSPFSSLSFNASLGLRPAVSIRMKSQSLIWATASFRSSMLPTTRSGLPMMSAYFFN